MSSRTSFADLALFARSFLAPFLLACAPALALVALLDLETGFGSGDDFFLYAWVALLASATLWALVGTEGRLRELLRRGAGYAVPALLALLVAGVAFGIDEIRGYEEYGMALLAAALVVRFRPGTEPVADTPSRFAAPAVSRRAFAAIAAAIVLLGTALCAYEALSTPTISVDESHSANAAYGILSRGLPYFPDTEVVYSRSWVNLYAMAGSFSVFGFSEWSARLPSVLAYAGALVFFFLALREIAGRRTALGALFLLAINPWVLHYGSYARMYIFLLLWSSAFAFLLLRYLRTRSPRILYLWMPLVLVLGLFSERTFLLFVPAYGLMVLWSLPRTRAFYRRVALIALGPVLLALAGVVTFWQQVSAFVSRYVIGFNNGANPLANAGIQGVPVEWLSYFGLPVALLLLSTVLIALRGDRRTRVLLALFWFGALLVDILIYSNFPARRFNYAFILVGLYTLVLAGGLSVFWKLARPFERFSLGVAVLALGTYASLYSFSFPAYADFSRLREIPAGATVIGYPTSPIAFYSLKYGLGMEIHPFITDTVEMNKYIQDGRDIYAGGTYVTGVSELNDLRADRDVYVLFEKTRMDFLNFRTNDYVYTNCLPLTDADALAIADAVRDRYEPDPEDYDTRNTLFALRCPQLTTI